MKKNITGRKVTVSDDLKKLIEKKLDKLDKFFRDDASAYVTLSKKRNLECIEITISSAGTLYRSEESNTTYNNALDRAVETIERQLRKNKTRLMKRLRSDAFVKDIPDSSIEEETEFVIRTKSFSIKPMSPEEAILQMNLLEHNFFVFSNDETNEINVVYKRNDGNYGMIVPMN